MGLKGGGDELPGRSAQPAPSSAWTEAGPPPLGAADGKACSSSVCIPTSSAAADLFQGAISLPAADVLQLPAGGGYLVVRRVRQTAHDSWRHDTIHMHPQCNRSGSSSCSAWTAGEEVRYQQRLQHLRRGLQLAFCRHLLRLSQVCFVSTFMHVGMPVVFTELPERLCLFVHTLRCACDRCIFWWV